MKIYLVSLNVVHGERLYKRHFAFSFNESVFVLKRLFLTQEECVYRDVVVQHKGYSTAERLVQRKAIRFRDW